MKITIDIDATNETILKNDLVDITDWINKAVIGKTEACFSRFKNEWDQKLIADPAVKSIPTNRADYISMITIRSDYKNRIDRDEEERNKNKNKLI